MRLAQIIVGGFALSSTLGCGSTVVTGHAPEGVVWLVVHPSGAPDPAGIFLYDVGRNQVSARLPFPAGMMSPQALAWDGESLWVSGIGGHGRVCELDPKNGRVRSEFELPERGAGGLAARGMMLWALGEGAVRQLRKLDHAGADLGHYLVSDSVTDLASDGAHLYWLVDYGQGMNAIERINPDTGERKRIAELPYLQQGRYALGYDGQSLLTVDSSFDHATGRRDRNALRWIDPASGETLDERPIPLRGWITALAWRSY